MLVTITGGTGFVGAHTVAALTRAGHRVRLLVRDESTVDAALTPLDVDPGAVDIAGGDVLDEAGVVAAVRGADAVLHAASVYSFDRRQHARIRRTNERGTELVLAAARRAGAGRIVHVSSVGALFPARGRVIGPDSPVGRTRETYLASKAAADRIARAHAADGAPVVISYPPALLGPHDPRLGDQVSRVRDVLRGLTPIWPLGGFPLGDVRDTAELHARLLTGAVAEPLRYFGPGHYVSTRAFVRTLRRVTGRSLPAVFLPARAMLPVGLLANLAQRVWPWHIPAEYGAIYTCACATRVAGAAPTAGVPARPVEETMRDTVRWLCRAGHVSARAAGAVEELVPAP
ncbi:MAG TPA: NAD-dependent epimerase/dehydratase family protein [Actinophytocola sp.]|uniref:NAD-dependent epimerase/dehydratase family protein n=1 Tax=Actinophytocola sp. TaxID=1872138 RepID=UPI002DB95079|nr:NAD-dependent epimerase/dehydratase family protein [Actinophytocola sp.]HEU5475558.1 NAD-dependent epimerase/dehydratase family protein [Actinophytocola sp.]